jgi:hypothetical protein
MVKSKVLGRHRKKPKKFKSKHDWDKLDDYCKKQSLDIKYFED